MSADDPIQVSWQNRQEQAALDALRPYLRPWRVTVVDQRDDFGRDAIVQVVDVSPDGAAKISPLTFWVQCKCRKAPLEDVHKEVVETRHLAIWAHPNATPVWLILYSTANDEFRLRSARDALQEVERATPNWRSQDSIAIEFRDHHKFSTAALAREHVCRRVIDECDHAGGREAFHQTIRRVLLTSLFRGTMAVSHKIQATRHKTVYLEFGENWNRREINPYEIHAERALAAGLMLFEQVVVQLKFAGVCMDLLGKAKFFDLLDRGRLKLWSFPGVVGFFYEEGVPIGEIASMAPPEDPLKTRLSVMVGKEPDAKETTRRLLPLIHVPRLSQSVILEQTRTDLRRANFRQLLGLTPHLQANDVFQPVWDAASVNRLLAVNIARGVAAELHADAIQYEGGLSRLSSEKDYGSFGLDRRFQTARAFDAALRACGTPDLGQLLQRIPFAELVELSDKPEAQDFRDWFWESAAPLTGSGANITTEFLSRVQQLIGDDVRAFKFAVSLKLRHAETVGEEYIVGTDGRAESAFASTDADGDRTLAAQRMFQAKLRAKTIRDRFGTLQPYDDCPCTSGQKFRFCCGRPLSKL